MGAFVVDVNVGVVANGAHERAGAACRLACVRALTEVRNGGICLDDGGRILAEYRRHLSPGGQAGAGDEFMLWVYHSQYNEEACERVPITRRPDDDRDFEEFPRDPDLAGFDRNDRKYVAVALGSSRDPQVLNASDTDWWIFHDALARHGVRVRFVCRELMPRDRAQR